MILVDTSVWVDYFGPRPQAKALRVREEAERGCVCVIPAIVQEVLQGARDQAHFEKLQELMSVAEFICPTVEQHIRAAHLYAECRWKGITPRSAIDCLIAQTAVEEGLQLLHDDRDFEQIARVLPSLQFA